MTPELIKPSARKDIEVSLNERDINASRGKSPPMFDTARFFDLRLVLRMAWRVS